MENGIEELITSTIAHIKTALDGNKPGEAKVYTEILSLLMLHCKPSVTPNVDMNRPFYEISEKHNPVVKTKTEINEMKMKPDYLNIADG